MGKLTAVALAAAVMMLASPSLAGPAWEWSGTLNNNSTSGSWDLGINFSVTAPVTVTGLGYYDDFGNGFLHAHDVALYNAVGTLLAGGIVTSADPLTGNFRYLNISGVTLAPGNYQVVGVSYNDNYTFDYTAPLGSKLTLGNSITYLGDSYNPDIGSGAAFVGIGSGLYNDDIQGGIADGVFGPDLFLATAVPEPLTLTMFAVGLAGIVATRRRKRNAT